MPFRCAHYPRRFLPGLTDSPTLHYRWPVSCRNPSVHQQIYLKIIETLKSQILYNPECNPILPPKRIFSNTIFLASVEIFCVPGRVPFSSIRMAFLRATSRSRLLSITSRSLDERLKGGGSHILIFFENTKQELPFTTGVKPILPPIRTTVVTPFMMLTIR